MTPLFDELQRILDQFACAVQPTHDWRVIEVTSTLKTIDGVWKIIMVTARALAHLHRLHFQPGHPLRTGSGLYRYVREFYISCYRMQITAKVPEVLRLDFSLD